MDDAYNETVYAELAYYTLSHPDKEYFIHQHLVDAYLAQFADEKTKEIAIIFSLVGLYLFSELGYTGKEVQLAHMKLSKNKVVWPKIVLPLKRGGFNIHDILQSAPGREKDELIKSWANFVWNAYHESHESIRILVKGIL